MTALLHCELWSDFQCNSGTRTAVILASHITSLVTTDRTTRDDDGALVLQADVPAVSKIADGVVLRLQLDDGAFREYRVHQVEDGNNGKEVRCTLRTPLLELQSAEVVSETTSLVSSVDLSWSGLTPADIVDRILAFCPSYWAAGTITPELLVDLTLSGWNPLQALRELVSAIRARGVGCELDFRRNGTTGYLLDIVTAIGASAAILDVRPGKNLRSLAREKGREKFAASVTVLGSGNATMGSAWFELNSKPSANVLAFVHPVLGGEILIANGQLDGYYAIDDTGARQLISNSTPSQFEVASGTNFTAGRWYRLARDSTGNDIITLPLTPSALRPSRIITADQDDTTNLGLNPSMRVWTGAASDPPDGWTQSGGLTITRTTSLSVFAGKSARCQAVASGSLFSPNLTVYVPTWVTHITASAWVRRVTNAASSSVFLEIDSSTVGSGTSWGAIATDTWTRIDYTHTSFTTGTTHALRVRTLVQGTNPNDAYVDAAQITFSSGPLAFTEGSNPAKLWALGNRYLSTYGLSEPISYSASFADLAAWDANQFPYDQAEVGQTAQVTDASLGVIASARIHELERDWRNPSRSGLTIASRPEDLASALSGIGGTANGSRRWTG